jgi:hypothetical protein
MIVGHNHHLLERRISVALLSGNAQPREAIFLHKISAKISARGKNASLTDAQARWLFALLERLKPTRPPLRSSPKPVNLSGYPHSQGLVRQESNETPSLIQPIQQGPLEPTRPPASPPHVVTSCSTESTSRFIKPKAQHQTPSTRPENQEILRDWTIRCFARLEARRKQREIWLQSKKYRRLHNQPIGPKDISSD